MGGSPHVRPFHAALFISQGIPVRWGLISISLQKLREVKSLALGHTVGKWQNQDLNPK